MIPKVSIIVPNYNHAQFLEERLESIFHQTFQDFEVILLDDASNDNSLPILKKYSSHSKVSHVVLNKENSGNTFLQWKRGIGLAKGELVWIAESDDCCKLNFLEELINVFEDNVVLSYSASININEENEYLGLNSWAEGLNKSRWKKNFKNSGHNEISNYLRYRNTIPNASAVLFKRSSLENVIFPLDMKYCGDWYIWLKILEKGNLVFVSEPLNFFRRHKATTRQNSSFENEIKRFKEYLLIVKSKNSLIHRIKNISKFDWILKERCRKKEIFGNYKLKDIGFPIDFVLRYYQLCKNIG